MSEELEVYVFEAVASTVERLEEIHIDWLIEGGPGALAGDTLLLSFTQGQLTEDWYGGEFVTKESCDALAAQRDEGLAREAELKRHLAEAQEILAKAIYRQWYAAPGYVAWVERGNSIMQDKARDEARRQLASPGCADGEKP